MADTKKITILLCSPDDFAAKHYGKLISEAVEGRLLLAKDSAQLFHHLRGPISPDLLVIDIALNTTQGEETLRLVRSEPGCTSLPMIVIAPANESALQLRLLDAGANEFVERGAPSALFAARLRTQLRHKFTLNRLSEMAYERDMFAAGVLHDIRGVEARILGVCDVARSYLKSDPLAHKAAILEQFEQLNAHASHLGNYASDVIQSVRAARHEAESKSLDLTEIVAWAKDFLGETLAVDLQGVKHSVLADQTFLRLVVLNILQNAVKYARKDGETGEGARVEMTQTVNDASQEGIKRTHVVTRIRDFGQGVRASELKKVFEPFVRGSSQSKGDHGSGLGLALVATVTAKMGGRVWAETPASGPGLTICLDLPAPEGSSEDPI